MFQYTFYNKKNFTSLIDLPPITDRNWVKPEDIESISPSLWAEHCLECAVPLCYNNCQNWVERIDKKCQKTFYGIKKVKTASYLMQAAQLQFRSWGKIESLIFPGFVPVDSYRRLCSQNFSEEAVSMALSKLLKLLSPACKLSGAQNYFANKRYKKVGKTLKPDEFLIQCYSKSEKEYNLLIEFFTPKGAFYRDSMTVKMGYNQYCIPVKNLDLHYDEDTRIKIYPENNLHAELVFFLCDFVQYKKQDENKKSPAKKVKCVAWDLDNTIWDGILIESDSDSLTLREGVLDTIRTLDKRGIIQIVASKNTEEDVLPVLERLGIRDYFVYLAVNWNAKSLNLKTAADWLNINIDTFALIDDSPYERGEVMENLSSVRIYCETEIKKLLSFSEFDVPVTEDSRNRRAMYQIEARRREQRKDFVGTNLDFLKNCELLMTVRSIDESNYMRSYELVQRTNQLNLSGRKYTEEEFQAIVDKNKDSAFVLFCRDRFGEYGQVGFFMVDKRNAELVITEYVVSCRVASKWIEPALLTWLQEKYRVDSIVFFGKNNQKNKLLINTLLDFGLKDMSEKEEELVLKIEAKDMNWPEVVSVKDEIE